MRLIEILCLMVSLLEEVRKELQQLRNTRSDTAQHKAGPPKGQNWYQLRKIDEQKNKLLKIYDS
jgi:hypothetical protein